jgi:hypothetical protein
MAYHAKAVARQLGQGPAATVLVPLSHPLLWWWHGFMLRQCIPCLHAKDRQKHRLHPCINKGVPPLSHTPHWATPHSPLSLVLLFSCIRARPSHLRGIGSLEEKILGMNINMGSSKVMSSLYYSHTYELEYSYYVMILIYKLVQSLCVMRVAYLISCLNNHITYIIKIRAKLRWRFIVPLGVPKFFTCQSVGSRTRGDLGSFYICKCGAWVRRDKWMHCPTLRLRGRWRWWQPCSSFVIPHVRLECRSLNCHMRLLAD